MQASAIMMMGGLPAEIIDKVDPSYANLPERLSEGQTKKLINMFYKNYGKSFSLPNAQGPFMLHDLWIYFKPSDPDSLWEELYAKHGNDFYAKAVDHSVDWRSKMLKTDRWDRRYVEYNYYIVSTRTAEVIGGMEIWYFPPEKEKESTP